MNDFDDFRLDGPPDAPKVPDRSNPLESSRAPWLVTIFLVVVAAVFVYLFFFRERRIVVPPPSTTTTQPAPAPAPAAAPPQVTPADAGLPPLDRSDALVRSLAHGLSSHPQLAEWLATKGLIRGFAVIVDNLADGKVPIQRLRLLAPKGRFRTAGGDANLRIDEREYMRFNGFADAVASLDTQGSVETYQHLKPLIVVAYRDLGHPSGNFDGALLKAISTLLSAPTLQGPVTLLHRSVAYQFANPDLEALLPAQKELIRMGPRNMRLIQDKVRALAEAAGFPDSSLPHAVAVRP